jgi:hypothetical protein
VPGLFTREAFLVLVQGVLLVSRTLLTDYISRIEGYCGRALTSLVRHAAAACGRVHSISAMKHNAAAAQHLLSMAVLPPSSSACLCRVIAVSLTRLCWSYCSSTASCVLICCA